MISRRVMQCILGAIWFLDGLLQLKPQMFTQSFVKEVILPTSQGQPHWISELVILGGHLVVGHIAVWNTLFAVVQLALGIAFIFNLKVKQTIIISLIWSTFVWVFGEGLGQIFTGQALLVTGAPGAVLIYGILGVSIWPQKDGELREWRDGCIRFSQISLAVMWAAGFALHLQPAYLTPHGLSQVISLPWLAKLIGNGGAVVSIVFAFMELSLSYLLLFQQKLRIAAWISIVLAVLFWWVGQSFGQILDPLSTDVNSGLLLALLAICANPNLSNWTYKGLIRHKMS